VRPLATLAWTIVASTACAAELTIDLGASPGITLVGAFARWDAAGNPRRSVNAAAKIDVPEVLVKAEPGTAGRWTFRNLPPGRYDLVVLAGKVRVEGFHYPPVLEFDPVLGPGAGVPEEARDAVVTAIGQSKHYENKVEALFLAGDDKQVRALVQLVRDQPTSYDSEYGKPVATIRHEVWQFTWRYGGWAKERRTKVLDRTLLPREELARWTWIWEPSLGGIEVGAKPITLSYRLPERPFADCVKGWIGNK
jgi:hypothetical protein